MLHLKKDVSSGDIRALFFCCTFISCLKILSLEDFQLICSHQPIVALVGDDVILPCHHKPAISATDRRVEWTKPDLDPQYVHVHQDGRLLYEMQNPSYSFRTRLFMDELEQGNMSMMIFRVRLSDDGRYRCFLPSVQEGCFVHLSVGSVSSPVINVTSDNRRRVVLECQSGGWYPEPEVLWLDAEGNLVSAGPTETVRGPDDLYTVSSRVTVEKRHGNSFTCRVQQKNINQTRETHIITGDFIEDTDGNSPVITAILVVIPVVLVIILCLKWISTTSHDKRREAEVEGEPSEPSHQVTWAGANPS